MIFAQYHDIVKINPPNVALFKRIPNDFSHPLIILSKPVRFLSPHHDMKPTCDK